MTEQGRGIRHFGGKPQPGEDCMGQSPVNPNLEKNESEDELTTIVNMLPNYPAIKDSEVVQEQEIFGI